MLTILTVPKPFIGHFAIIQQNAILSWKQLRTAPQIILLGDEAGVAEFARRHELTHIPLVSLNEYGSVLLDDVFRKAQQDALYNTLAYVNADIILGDDFIDAVEMVISRVKRPFMMVGERQDYNLTSLIDFSVPTWKESVIRDAKEKGVPHGFGGVDYFVFRKKHLPVLPPFIIG